MATTQGWGTLLRLEDRSQGPARHWHIEDTPVMRTMKPCIISASSRAGEKAACPVASQPLSSVRRPETLLALTAALVPDDCRNRAPSQADAVLSNQTDQGRSCSLLGLLPPNPVMLWCPLFPAPSSGWQTVASGCRLGPQWLRRSSRQLLQCAG